MKMITNGDNPVIKKIKSLKQKKYRDRYGIFFIEGLRFTEEVLKEYSFGPCMQINIESMIVSESFNHANIEFMNTYFPDSMREDNEHLSENMDVHHNVQNHKCSESCDFNMIKVSDKIFSSISDTETPQGIGAVLRISNYDESEIIKNGRNFLMMDRIQDPGNMGTLIRTADAAAFDAVILSDGCVDMYNSKVLRATMGSIFHIPVIQSADLSETIQRMKENHVKIYAADLNGNQSSFSEEFSDKNAIITGNESNGIRREVLDTADVLLKIPMPGSAESLNASVAGSLLMYEVLRKTVRKSGT